jgi:hypothetical protein
VTLEDFLEIFLCGPKGGDEEIDPALLDVIRDSHRLFLKAGGVVPPEVWMTIPIAIRAAMAAAGDDVRRESAAWTGLAASGPEGFAEVMAPLDHGLSIEQMQNDARSGKLFEQAVGSSVEPIRKPT